jgi:hypothetical protein
MVGHSPFAKGDDHGEGESEGGTTNIGAPVYSYPDTTVLTTAAVSQNLLCK